MFDLSMSSPCGSFAKGGKRCCSSAYLTLPRVFVPAFGVFVPRTWLTSESTERFSSAATTMGDRELEDERVAASSEPSVDNIGPKNAIGSVAVSIKSPPPESSTSIHVRSLVIISFWLVVICLGLPTWWWTTSIYRARLPLQEMLEWADGKVSSPSYIATKTGRQLIKCFAGL